MRRGEKEGGLQRAPGERLLPPRSGEQRGPASQARAGGRRRSRSTGGAALRDAARRKQSSARRGPARGCRSQAPGGGGGAVLPEPTPPSPARLPAPAQPPAASGAVLKSEHHRARGLAAADSSRHAPAGTAPAGGEGAAGSA